jgi:hypothetical protein
MGTDMDTDMAIVLMVMDTLDTPDMDTPDLDTPDMDLDITDTATVLPTTDTPLLTPTDPSRDSDVNVVQLTLMPMLMLTTDTPDTVMATVMDTVTVMVMVTDIPVSIMDTPDMPVTDTAMATDTVMVTDTTDKL